MPEKYDEEYDEFNTSTGLKDDYDGIITDAYFGKGQQGDRYNLFLKVTADDGDEVEIRYSIGNGWESYDGGKTVENTVGERYFNNRTAWAETFSAMMDLGAKEELGRRSKALERRGPKDSRLVVGLKFHWMVQQISMTVPKRDEMGQPIVGQREQISMPRVVPTKYLGTAEDQSPKSGGGATGRRRTSSAGTTPTESTTPSSESPSSPANGDGIDPGLLVKVKVLAKTSAFPEWVDKVMDLPGALDDNVLVSKLNEEFYAELKG